MSCSSRFNHALLGLLVAPLLLIVLVTSIAGCGNEKKADSNNKPLPVLKIGLGSWIGYAPLFIADELELDKKNGIDLQITRLTDNSVRRDALIAGELDVNITTIDMAAISASESDAVRIFFATDASTGGDGLIAKESIKSISDLRNSSIGVDLGTPSHFFLLYILDQEHVAPSDVHIQHVRTGDTPDLLKLGAFDAIVTWEPWLTKAKDYGFHVVASTKENNELIIDVFETRQDVIDGKRKLLEALICTWQDALKLTSTPDGLMIMSKAYEKEPEVFNGMLSEMKWLDLDDNRRLLLSGSPSKVENILTNANRLWFESGNIKHVISSEMVVNKDILETVSCEQNN